VVERDKREGAEGPEDGGVGESGERALANNFGLEEDFPDEVADAPGDGEEVKAWILFGFEDFREDDAEAAPECPSRGEGEGGEEEFLDEGEVLGLGESWETHDHQKPSKGTWYVENMV
jgi:hypothetical protein